MAPGAASGTLVIMSFLPFNDYLRACYMVFIMYKSTLFINAATASPSSFPQAEPHLIVSTTPQQQVKHSLNPRSLGAVST
jgi:hypothetical protein